MSLESYIIKYLPIFFSLIAVSVSVLTWKRNRQDNLYKLCDDALRDIVKITLDYPQYRDKKSCEILLAECTGPERLRYEAYATIVWNYMESLYELYGEKLAKTSFYGAFRFYADLHSAFLDQSNRRKYYDSEMLEFLGAANTPDPLLSNRSEKTTI